MIFINYSWSWCIKNGFILDTYVILLNQLKFKYFPIKMAKQQPTRPTSSFYSPKHVTIHIKSKDSSLDHFMVLGSVGLPLFYFELESMKYISGRFRVAIQVKLSINKCITYYIYYIIYKVTLVNHFLLFWRTFNFNIHIHNHIWILQKPLLHQVQL